MKLLNYLLLTVFFLAIFTASPAQSRSKLFFREDWKEIEAALPVTGEHVANATLCSPCTDPPAAPSTMVTAPRGWRPFARGGASQRQVPHSVINCLDLRVVDRNVFWNGFNRTAAISAAMEKPAKNPQRPIHD